MSVVSLLVAEFVLFRLYLAPFARSGAALTFVVVGRSCPAGRLPDGHNHTTCVAVDDEESDPSYGVHRAARALRHLPEGVPICWRNRSTVASSVRAAACRSVSRQNTSAVLVSTSLCGLPSRRV